MKRLIGTKTALYSLPCFVSRLSQREQSIGTKVRAAVVDTIMMIETIQPSWANMMPAMPLIIVSGRNTQSIVSVEAMTEMPTSPVPCTAASLGFSPRAMCVETFSSTTMASSTTMPMAMASADIEMMFRVLPVAYRYISEASRASGMDRTMMKVDFQFPRKRKTTSITTRKVMMMVSMRVRIVLMISREPSTIVVIFTSEGSVFSICASCFLTPLMTFTVLASLCFWMTTRAARRPFV